MVFDIRCGYHIPIFYDMVTHMKTTVEISDSLLKEAKAVAAEQGTTLRELIQSGLQRVLKERARKKPQFTLSDESVGGKGLNPDFEEGGWDAIRREIYAGRG